MEQGGTDRCIVCGAPGLADTQIGATVLWEVYMGRKRREVSAEVKQEVVDLVKTSGKSIAQIAVELRPASHASA